MFLSPARVAGLHRGEEQDEGTKTTVEVFQGLAAMPAVWGANAMVDVETMWPGMVVALTNLGFHLSVVRQRESGWYEEDRKDERDADGNETERVGYEDDTYFVQFE